MKYKIGDKVEIVKLDDDSAVVKIGDTGVIDGIYDKGDYKIRVNINGVKDYGFNVDEIKLVGDLAEKLTTEDILELKKMVLKSISKANRDFKSIEWSLNDSKKCLMNEECEDDWDTYEWHIENDTKRLELARNEIIKFNRLDNILSDMEGEYE